MFAITLETQSSQPSIRWLDAPDEFRSPDVETKIRQDEGWPGNLDYSSYRQKVTALAQALEHSETRTQASEALRGLIDAIN